VDNLCVFACILVMSSFDISALINTIFHHWVLGAFYGEVENTENCL
jgi:hypothetical protein